MDENETTDSPFVVITGNPQRGKGERISRVRSHITKRRHQQDGRRKTRLLQPLTRMSTYYEIDCPPVPSMLSLAHIGHQRMQSFLDQYLYYSRDVHPSFRIVILAALNCAPLMSAKILTASAWDDLNNMGEISDLTLSQVVITRGLINQSLSNVQEATSDASIAALVSILIFDLVNEDHNSFSQHKQVIYGLIRMRGGMQVLGFEGHLAKSMPLIEQLQKVIKISTSADHNSRPGSIFPTIAQPLNLRIFTFSRNHDTSPEPITPLLAMILSHFSRMLFVSREGACHSSPTGFKRCCIAQHMAVCHELVAIRPFTANCDDTKAEAILHAALLFSWSGFVSYNPDSIDWSESLIALRTSLRHPDLDRSWAHLPGALIWCLVVGARLAWKGSIRKWFMMQLVRVTSCIALEQGDEVLQSLRLIVGGLDAAEMLADLTVLGEST